jgi:hypothetical protein
MGLKYTCSVEIYKQTRDKTKSSVPLRERMEWRVKVLAEASSQQMNDLNEF